MEPMTLGSPIGSPSSPSPASGSGAASSSFLPAFLMGDTLPGGGGGGSPHLPNPHSPQKTPRQVTFSRLQSATTPQQSKEGRGVTPVESRARSLHVTQSEKSGGIPTVGLFDTLDTSSVPQSPLTNITNTLNYSIGSQASLQEQLLRTKMAYRTSKLMHPCMQVQPDTSDRVSNCEPGSQVTADHWVTVFGFPPSSASTVLAQFSQLGQLQEHVFPPKGNWMHLRYFSKMEARRAYSYNAKVFGGSTMIGVVPCKDPSIIKDLVPTAPSSPAMLPRRMMSPDPPGTPISSHWDNSFMGGASRARPLNRTPHPDTEVLCQQNTPTKSSSVVSRTFEYFLGW